MFFTQRGTQGAQPFLDCEGYSLRELNAGTQGLTPKESRAAGRAAFQACVADFTAQGVDLGAYNSVENAADIVDIKDALGYDTIVYVGESYGTQLGQFLLRDHPEALSAIVLDGVVPVTKTSEIAGHGHPGSFQRVWAACAADAGCAKAYPDPEGTLTKTIKALDKQPVTVSVDLGQGSPTETLRGRQPRHAGDVPQPLHGRLRPAPGAHLPARRRRYLGARTAPAPLLREHLAGARDALRHQLHR